MNSVLVIGKFVAANGCALASQRGMKCRRLLVREQRLYTRYPRSFLLVHSVICQADCTVVFLSFDIFLFFSLYCKERRSNIILTFFECSLYRDTCHL